MEWTSRLLNATRPGNERYAFKQRAAIRRPMNATQTGSERNADGQRVETFKLLFL